MANLQLDVETLRCEADEASVVDYLRARPGVREVQVDLRREQVELDVDEAAVSTEDLHGYLGFLGLEVRS